MFYLPVCLDLCHLSSKKMIIFPLVRYYFASFSSLQAKQTSNSIVSEKNEDALINKYNTTDIIAINDHILIFLSFF